MTDPGPSLFVPINVTALCVGDTDVNGRPEEPGAIGTKAFAQISDDFSTLPYLDAGEQMVNERSNISDRVVPDPFTAVTAPLTQGIHLHWALPGALTRGSTREGEPVGFPEAPNRWLIVRVAINSANPGSPAHAAAGWIIESDRLWEADAQPSRAVPVDADPLSYPNKTFMSMGRAVPWESWSEPASGRFASRHTAVGYGNETYAAAYPHCRNVFGFHDTLQDFDLTAFPASSSRLSYFVAGWYGTPAHDPLRLMKYADGATDDEKCAAIREEYGWSFDRDAASAAPAQIVCSGTLIDITWDPHNRHYIYARDADPVTVAIGNTAVEALSALAASQPSASGFADAETLLTALQLGLLPGLDQPGGAAVLDDKLHQEGFAATSRGCLYAVTRKTSGDKVNPDGTHAPVDVTAQNLLDAASAHDDPLPEPLGDALNRLNAAQQACNQSDREIDSRRSQIFADWYKYMVLQYDEREGVQGVTYEEAYHFLVAEVAALNAGLTAAENHLAPKRDAALRDVNNQLGSDFTLRTIAEPRFWHPRDPVVLLQGTDLVADARYGLDPGAADVRCRMAGSVLSSMNAGSGFTLSAGPLPQLPQGLIDPRRADLTALLAESFFVDANQASLLASLLAAEGGAGNPAIVDRAGCISQIQTAQKNFYAPEPAPTVVSFTRSAPAAFSVSAWSPPWIPILLQWRVTYQPVLPVGSVSGAAAAYPEDFLSNFTLDDEDIELVYKGATPATFANPQSYDGTIVLGRNTDLNLKAQIDAYIQHFPDPKGELAAIAKGPKLAAMAQSLSGLHQGLLLRHQILQLPVSDPLALKMSGQMRADFLNNDVVTAVGDRNDAAPVPNGYYNPVRAGWMTISELRVVDAFGQVREIPRFTVVRARGVVPHDAPSNAAIALPPRFTQPARLQFRWLSADDDLVEMNSDPATSPVCGWVLFNRLDGALMIYDAAGAALGSLNTRGPLWQGAPGNTETFGKSIVDAFRGRNPHLAKLAMDIYNRNNAVPFLADLLTAIDRTATNINPPGFKQDQALSVLIGRPLALVRASVSLELDGLPSLNQSWDAYVAAVPARQITDRDSCRFASIDVPVRLGDLGRADDGLVGYFIESGDATYATFYAHAATTTGNGVVAPAPNQLTTQADPAAPPSLLTMLVDPCAPVHATTGLLPVKAIEIPAAMYGPALNRMAVTFLTSPVLSATSAFAVPLPDERGYDWSWVSRAGSTWSVLDRVPPLNPAKTFVDQGPRVVEGWLRLTKRREN